MHLKGARCLFTSIDPCFRYRLFPRLQMFSLIIISCFSVIIYSFSDKSGSNVGKVAKVLNFLPPSSMRTRNFLQYVINLITHESTSS